MHLAPLDSARERRRSHILNARRRIKVVPSSALRASLVRRSLLWLFPYLDNSQGLYRLSTVLLSCSVGSLRHWLHGRRNMPDRVRLILIATIRARIESGLAVLAELEAAKPAPRSNPAVNLHGAKARKAKAADDAASAESA